VSEPAPAKGATPEREWTAEECSRGIELFKQGTSIRRLSAALGVSRHQAERFMRECKAALNPKPVTLDKPPEPRSPFQAATLAPRPARFEPPLTPAPFTRAPEPERDFETLQRTRQELKSKLDRAAQLGDRQGVATYSLAIARLNSTADPGAALEGASTLQFSGISDAVLGLLLLATRACRERLPAEDGSTRDPFNTAEQAHFALWSAAIDAVAVRLEQPATPGATLAIKFKVP